MENKEILKNILISDNVVEEINNNIIFLIKNIPEIKYMIGFDQKNPHHHLDVWNHTLYALSLSECDFDIRLSLLLHDIGKPFCFQDKEIRHFYGHPKVSATIANEILERLEFDSEDIKKICYLIENHDTPIKEKDIIENYELQLKRFEIQRCDVLAHHPEKLEKRKKYLEKTKIMLKI